MPKAKPKPKAPKTLTGPQAAFCRAYAVSQNGTQAYKEAYGNASLASCASSANALLRFPHIQAEIMRLRAPAEKSTRLTLADKHEILREIARDKSAKHSDRISAVLADGKYAGDFAVEKMEVTVFETPEAIMERARARGLMGGGK